MQIAYAGTALPVDGLQLQRHISTFSAPSHLKSGFELIFDLKLQTLWPNVSSQLIGRRCTSRVGKIDKRLLCSRTPLNVSLNAYTQSATT